ncbi:hypothetical protein ABPG72_007176 [Tetrahymena utriculariae]
MIKTINQQKLLLGEIMRNQNFNNLNQMNCFNPILTPTQMQTLTYIKANEIAESFKNNYNDGVVVMDNIPLVMYDGSLVLQYSDLRIYRVASSWGMNISSDELKSNLFVWVYDSMNQQVQERIKFLYAKVKQQFPHYNIFVSIGNRPTTQAYQNTCGVCLFENYGGDVLILLF